MPKVTVEIDGKRVDMDSELLRVVDTVEWHDNARVVKTIWYLGDVEVKSDIHVIILRGHTLTSSHGEVS